MLEAVLRIHEIFGTDPDVNPDSDICISDLQEVNKKLCFLLITF
jgi:hypothetical protein